MKRLVCLLCVVAIIVYLSGCASPVSPRRELPEPGPELSAECKPPITLRADQKTAADGLDVVTENYKQHRICAARLSAWQKFYKDLKDTK